jgi:hypothetical protein
VGQTCDDPVANWVDHAEYVYVYAMRVGVRGLSDCKVDCFGLEQEMDDRKLLKRSHQVDIGPDPPAVSG